MGTKSRWERIAPLLQDHGVETLLDIGCNVGWFSINAAKMGISVIGLEIMPKNYRTLIFTRNKLNMVNLGVLILDLSPRNVSLLPMTDAVLFMSVWHHLVRLHGLEGATKTLRCIWRKTARVLFFETGEDEMPLKFNLPDFGPDAKAWITEYLLKSCTGAEVLHLGKHRAFAPDGSICKRNLFAIVKTT